jgi:glucokinase
VSAAGELLLRPARHVAQEFTMRGLGTKTEIRIARYGPDAGVRGAALLALTEEAAAAG